MRDSLGISLNPVIIPRETYPITGERTLTQEDIDRVWPGQKLPEAFRKESWKHEPRREDPQNHNHLES